MIWGAGEDCFISSSIKSWCSLITIHKRELLSNTSPLKWWSLVSENSSYGYIGLSNFQDWTNIEIANYSTTTSASKIPVTGYWEKSLFDRQLILRMTNESCDSGRDPPPTPCLLASDWLSEQWKKSYECNIATCYWWQSMKRYSVSDFELGSVFQWLTHQNHSYFKRSR